MSEDANQKATVDIRLNVVGAEAARAQFDAVTQATKTLSAEFEKYQKLNRAERLNLSAQQEYQDFLALREEVDFSAPMGVRKPKGFWEQARHRGSQLKGVVAGGLTSSLAGSGSVYGVAIAATIATLDKALQATAKSVNVLNDQFMSEAKKTQTIAEEFIPLVRSARQAADAINGMSQEFQKAEREFQIGMKREAIEGEYRSRSREFEFQKTTQTQLAQSIRSNPLPSVPQFDLTTYRGQIKQQEENQRTIGRDALVRARRENEVANAQHRDATQSIAEQEAAIARARRDRGEAEKRAEAARQGGRSGVSTAGKIGIGIAGPVALGASIVANSSATGQTDLQITHAVNDALRAGEEISRRQTQLETERVRQMEAAKRVAESESAIRKANIEIGKQELEIIKSRNERVRSQTTRIGEMDEIEFRNTVQGAKLALQYGDKAPQQAKDALRRLSPGFAATQDQARGERRLRSDDLKKQFGDQYKELFPDLAASGSLREGLQEQQKLELNLRGQVQLDEEKLADKVAQAFDPVIQGFLKAVEIRIEKAAKDLKDTNYKRAAAQQ
jgi:hypothetical protein